METRNTVKYNVAPVVKVTTVPLKARGLSPIRRAVQRSRHINRDAREVIAECLGMVGASIAAVIFALLALTSCSNHDDSYDEMPPKVQTFVSKYFPNFEVDSYTATADTYRVKLKDGPGITFDKDQMVENVNGYGMPLPGMLLFDTLPPKLYQYIEADSALNSVFAIEFSAETVYAVLLDYSLIYDNATGEIRQVTTPPA